MPYFRLQERQKKDRKDMSRSESSDDNMLGVATEATSGPQQVRVGPRKII